MSKNNIISKKTFGLFLFGCILTNYPIISLFNKKAIIFGLPLLCFYMFFIWIALIILIILFTKPPATKSEINKNTKPGPVDPC